MKPSRARNLVGLLCCLAPLSAQAAIIRSGPPPSDLDQGPYATLRVGGSFLDDIQPGGNNLTGEHLAYDDGLAGGGAIGYAFGGGPRLELEGEARYNSVARTQGLPIAAGRTYQYSGFLAGLYDFDLGLAVKPHLGFAVGGTEVVTLRSFHVIGLQSPNGKDLAFSYKVIAGLEIPVVQHCWIGLDYQYIDTPEVSVATRFGYRVAPTANFGLTDSAIFLSVRFDLDGLFANA